MGIRRSILEACVTTMRKVYRYRKAKEPLSILVLRNNDLGDLVIITPLFQALRRAFPDSHIAAGVGSWSKDILKNNPYISEVIDCNAPWHNHCTGRKSLLKALRYIFMSREVARLRAKQFDVGIDVLGSPFGSMLFIHLRIPIRLGRKGYAGGHTGSTAYLDAGKTLSVAKSASEFVGLLKSGVEVDLGSKPQLFLDAHEIEEAERVWLEIEATGGSGNPRIVVAPGAGAPEKQWPVENFAELAGRLSEQTCGCVIGSQADWPLGEEIARELGGWSNRCGKVSLRQSMALISLADLVICHGSFAMHLAAAFEKRCVLILTRLQDPKSHAELWEVDGVHYQLFPRDDEQHVRVADVESQARLLLGCLR
jgi:ADP-heptose:LPS heptosyltransferase